MTAPIAVSLTIPDISIGCGSSISRVLTELLARHHGDAVDHRRIEDRAVLVLQRRDDRAAGGSERTSERTNERGTACVANDSPRKTAGPPDDDASSLAFGLDGQSRRMDAWMDRWIDGQTPRGV